MFLNYCLISYFLRTSEKPKSFCRNIIILIFLAASTKCYSYLTLVYVGRSVVSVLLRRLQKQRHKVFNLDGVHFIG